MRTPACITSQKYPLPNEPYSTSSFVCSFLALPPHQGADKYENEDLIKYSLPHDIWFHVDALSSAHVYLRLPEGG